MLDCWLCHGHQSNHLAWQVECRTIRNTDSGDAHSTDLLLMVQLSAFICPSSSATLWHQIFLSVSWGVAGLVLEKRERCKTILEYFLGQFFGNTNRFVSICYQSKLTLHKLRHQPVSTSHVCMHMQTHSFLRMASGMHAYMCAHTHTHTHTINIWHGISK